MRPPAEQSRLERMKRIAVEWCICLAVVTLLAACSTTETKQGDKIYNAYGDTWVYSKTAIHTEYLALVSPHGILGPRSAYKERHLIRNSAGKAISIPDNLYALQKDGTLKKIECCQYSREQGDLYDIDDRLVFVFNNARKFITDCFIYPGDGVTVFAEFDPQAGVFNVKTFHARDNYLPLEYTAALLRSGRRDFTFKQHYAFLYYKRKAFMCQDSGLAPETQITRSLLNMDAYQYGATRTLQLSVMPAATDLLLDFLQSFALRKGFKTWNAGAAKEKEVSLALQGEEILTIAAGDDVGRWRLGFYRRVPKAESPIPSEEKVDGLLREIKSELGKLPGVAFAD